MMTCLRYLAVSLCILAGGCAAREKVPASTTRPAAMDDLARLQGEWAMVSGTADGFELPETMVPNFKRICRGDELTVMNGAQLIMKSKIVLDRSKSPRTIDDHVIDGPT